VVFLLLWFDPTLGVLGAGADRLVSHDDYLVCRGVLRDVLQVLPLVFAVPTRHGIHFVTQK
jgi:hypothetical protein